jgi:hypothetical protein
MLSVIWPVDNKVSFNNNRLKKCLFIRQTAYKPIFQGFFELHGKLSADLSTDLVDRLTLEFSPLCEQQLEESV